MGLRPQTTQGDRRGGCGADVGGFVGRVWGGGVGVVVWGETGIIHPL